MLISFNEWKRLNEDVTTVVYGTIKAITILRGIWSAYTGAKNIYNEIMDSMDQLEQEIGKIQRGTGDLAVAIQHLVFILRKQPEGMLDSNQLRDLEQISQHAGMYDPQGTTSVRTQFSLDDDYEKLNQMIWSVAQKEKARGREQFVSKTPNGPYSIHNPRSVKDWSTQRRPDKWIGQQF